ncbi:MAG: universal stress protein [Streptosporangiaceae bacterium]
MRFASPRASGRARIVVGVDGSPNSLAALNRAGYLARMSDASLDMVYVIPARASAAAESVGLEMLDMCARYLASRGLGVAPEQTVARGEPGRVLVQLSVTAERLVLGGSARAERRDSPGGDVVPYCLAHSHCPVDVCADQRTRAVRMPARAGGDRWPR